MSATHTAREEQSRPAGSKLREKQERTDAALLWALTIHTDSDERWGKLKAGGATEEQILAALSEEFGQRGGGSQTDDGIQFAYRGGETPVFWVGGSSPYTTAKPTLQGEALVRRARKVLGLPRPGEAAKGEGKRPFVEPAVRELSADEAQGLGVAVGSSPESARVPEAPDADLLVARLNFVETLPEFQQLVGEFGLDGLCRSRKDSRFSPEDEARLLSALDECAAGLGMKWTEEPGLASFPTSSEGEARATDEAAGVDPAESQNGAENIPEIIPQFPDGDSEFVTIARGRPSSDTVMLNPAFVRTDGGTQARAALDEAAVADYAEKMRDGEVFPEVVVFYDGREYWLADGFHRHAATVRAELAEIAADVRQGTRRDAVLYAVGANARHGLRRTDADKRRAVETLLADPEWSKWSNREIARQCGVSKGFVGDVRESLSGSRAPEEVVARRGGVEYTVSTSNLAGPKAGPAPAEAHTSLSEEPTPAAVSAEAGGSTHAPAPEASAGAHQQAASVHTDEPEAHTAVVVNNRRRIRPEDVAAASPSHVAARPDAATRMMERWAAIQKRLNGRGFYVAQTFLPKGLGTMLTVNIALAPPTDAVNSKLFSAPAGKMPYLTDDELDLIEKRLDAEKSKPKAGSKKSATKSEVLKNKAAAKAAAAHMQDGPGKCSNCSKRIKEGRTHTFTAKGKCAEYVRPAKHDGRKGLPGRLYAIGDSVRVKDRLHQKFGSVGEVTGHYTEDTSKFQVKIQGKYFTLLAAQLTLQSKKAATKGGAKKPASKKGGK